LKLTLFYCIGRNKNPENILEIGPLPKKVFAEAEMSMYSRSTGDSDGILESSLLSPHGVYHTNAITIILIYF